jgi:hypothetical protein
MTENKFSPKILYPPRLPFKLEGRIKIFHDKQKQKQYMTSNPTLQKTLKGILHTEDENNHSHEKMGSIKFKKIADKKVESSIELVAYTQTLIQQKQLMAGIITYLSILTLNVNGINTHSKTSTGKLD